MWFNSGSWQAQLGLFLAHIALSTASGQSIRGAVLNHRVTAGKKPMHTIWGMRATLRTRTRTRLPARPGIMNRMSKCVQNPSHTLHQWTETPVSMLLIAVLGNAQIEASLLMLSRLSYATPLLARRRLHDGAQHAPGRPRGPKQTPGGNPRTRARARPAGTDARVSLVRQNPVRVGRTAQPGVLPNLSDCVAILRHDRRHLCRDCRGWQRRCRGCRPVYGRGIDARPGRRPESGMGLQPHGCVAETGIHPSWRDATAAASLHPGAARTDDANGGLQPGSFDRPTAVSMAAVEA